MAFINKRITNTLCVAAIVVAWISLSAAVAEDDVFCKSYVKVEDSTMDAEEDITIKSAIKVFDKFDVTSIQVAFNLTHTRMGALKIGLQAIEPRGKSNRSPEWAPNVRTTTLMFREGRKQKVLENIVFDDKAAAPYPEAVNVEEAPPSTGIFQPTTPLFDIAYGQSELAGMGGAKGWWRLVIRDVSDSITPRTGTLQGWKLTLCGREMPAMPSDEWVQDTINGLPKDNVPTNTPASDTIPEAITETTIITGNSTIEVPLTGEVTDDNDELPLESTYADDNPLVNATPLRPMPIWEYARAWIERTTIYLGMRV